MRLAVQFFVPLGRALDGVLDEFGDDKLDVVRRFLERSVEAVESTRREAGSR